MCGQNFTAELLVASSETRMPQFGYEVGKEMIIDILTKEEEKSVWQRFSRQMEMSLVGQTLQRSQAIRNLRRTMITARRNWNRARDAFLCSGLNDSDFGVGIREHENEIKNGLSRNRHEKELARQVEFEQQMQELRMEVENTTFAKPTCSRCLQLCKERIACQETRVDLDFVSSSIGNNKAKSWKKMLQLARNPPQPKGVGRLNAVVLARGGSFCEPVELTKQCGGRVHPDTAQCSDEVLEHPGFCDVRFDRPCSWLNQKPPPKVHCFGTGRVFCSSCAGFQVKLVHCFCMMSLPETLQHPGKATRTLPGPREPTDCLCVLPGLGGEKGSATKNRICHRPKEPGTRKQGSCWQKSGPPTSRTGRRRR